MDNKQLRQTAFIARISDLKNSKYVKEEGWEPNYILTDWARISRANILGIVISKADSPDSSFKTLVVDDGNGNIDIRQFEDTNLFSGINVGDIVLVIGRPREYGNEKYVLPEIVRKLDRREWLLYRKKELELFDLKNENSAQQEPHAEKEPEEEMIVEEEVIRKESLADRIIKMIKEKDGGKGVDIEEVVDELKSPDSESVISFLLKQGELFELTPGKLKVL